MPDTLNIFHAVCGLAPQLGGPSTAAIAYAEHLSDAGQSVRLVCTDQGIEGKCRDDLTNVPEKLKCSVYRYNRIFKKLYWVPGLWKQLDTLQPQPDLVHLHGIYSYFCAQVGGWCRARKIPYIVRTCGHLSSGPGEFGKKFFHQMIDKALLSGAARVQFATKWEKDHSEWASLSNNSFIAPPPITWPPELESLSRDRYQEKPYIAFLGRIHPIKGIHHLLSAFTECIKNRSLAGKDLLLAGHAEGEFRTQMEGLNKRNIPVRWVGNVSGDDKWRFLRDAECLILPSHHENFGIVCIEALSVGTPLVLSRNVALAADLEAPDVAVVFDYGETDDQTASNLTTALSKLSKKKSAKAKRAAEPFHPEKSIQNLLSIYSGLLTKSVAG